MTQRFGLHAFLPCLALACGLLVAVPSAADEYIDDDGRKVVNEVLQYTDVRPGSDANSWGDEANCTYYDIVTSACGSGANADCAGHPVQINCSSRAGGATDKLFPDPGSDGTKYYSSSWGERIVCPTQYMNLSGETQQVVVGICGSGADPNCGGKPNYVTCKDLFYGNGSLPGDVYALLGTLSDPVWISSSDFGAFVSCPQGTVATGFCGSGANKDCNGNVTEIQCSTVTMTTVYKMAGD